MRVLFVHQNFPGQYLHLAPALAARGDEVVALSIEAQKPLPGVRVFRYRPRRGSSTDIHAWVADVETKVIRGEAAARAALELRANGFAPDVICAHPGWGEALFLKDVFPKTRMLSFVEFWYRAEGADFGFDPEFAEDDVAARCRLRMKNANSLLNLDAADWCVTPTEWQRSTVPANWRDRLTVIHDGIDTECVKPDAKAVARLAKSGLALKPGDEVVTFVARNLEPYRGFHVFMRALAGDPEAPAERRGADRRRRRHQLRPASAAGRDLAAEDAGGGERPNSTCGASASSGGFSYDDFVALLRVSAHVYLTYPFVLSWSMLEAMSAGCLVIGSATPPVEEVIRDGDNGLLVHFFSPPAIAPAVDGVLSHRDRMADVRQRARETVIERHDLRGLCLPRHVALVDAVASGRPPPDAGDREIAGSARPARVSPRPHPHPLPQAGEAGPA